MEAPRSAARGLYPVLAKEPLLSTPAATAAPRLGTAALFTSLVLLSAGTVAFELNLVAFVGYEVSDRLLILSSMVGLYLFFMGVGAWLSRTASDPALAYVACAVAASAFGGVSVGALTSVYYGMRSFWPSVVLFTALVAGPCGAALPLAVRALSERRALRSSLSESLGLDYAGALAGALAYSLLLLPAAGMVQGGAIIGAVTLGAALLALPSVAAGASRQRSAPLVVVVAGILLLAGWKLPGWVDELRDTHQKMRTVFVKRTPYQEIRVRRGISERLFLNNQVQYDSMAEYIYHELLVHPAFALHGKARRVLVLGGGDGLALREIWKHRGVRKVTLIDIDPAMTDFGRTYPGVVKLNKRSFEDPRLTILHRDAWKFVEGLARGQRKEDGFDIVVADLPSPTSISLSRLYTVTFYKRLRRLLRPGGLIVVQSGSIDHREGGVPFCIQRSMQEAGLNALLYQSELLAFSLASNGPLTAKSAADKRPKLGVKTRYLSEDLWPALFQQPNDIRGTTGEANTLETHAVLKYSTW